MLLTELFATESAPDVSLTDDELAAINKQIQHQVIHGHFWDTRPEMQDAVKRRQDEMIQQRVENAIKKALISKSGLAAREKYKQTRGHYPEDAPPKAPSRERFPGWKLSADGWGGD